MLVEPRRGEFGRRTQFSTQDSAPPAFQARSYESTPYGGSERIVMARWKVGLFFLLSLSFLGVFALIPMARWGPKVWLGVLVFGFGVFVFGLNLVKPATLDLDAEGFTYAGGLTKTRRVAWRDVERFFLWKPPRGARMVAYQYKDGAQPPSIMRSLNRMVGVDGSLPNLFAIKPQDLMEKLEGYRQRAC